MVDASGDDEELYRRLKALRPANLPEDASLAPNSIGPKPPAPPPEPAPRQPPVAPSGSARARNVGSHRNEDVDDRLARRKARREEVRKALEKEMRSRQWGSGFLVFLAFVAAGAWFIYHVYFRV